MPPPPGETKFRDFIRHATKQSATGTDKKLIKEFYDIVSDPNGYTEAAVRTFLIAKGYDDPNDNPEEEDFVKIKNLVDSTRWAWNLEYNDY